MKTTHHADLSAVDPVDRPFWCYEYGIELVPLYAGPGPAEFYINEEALPLGPRAFLLGLKVSKRLDPATPVATHVHVLQRGVVIRPVLSLVAGGVH